MNASLVGRLRMAISFFDRIRRSFNAGGAGRAERPLQILIVASFVLPVSVFLVASWISYGAHFDDARDRLERTRGIVREHAIKVFDTFEISARYLDELTTGQSDTAIRKDEAEYSLRIKNFIQNLPQLRDLWIIDAAGRPLASGTIYPMPQNLDLSDRDYFTAQKNNIADFTYVSQVVQARAADTNFFAVTRKRVSNDGKFAGVNLVSIAPEYFANYYATLPGVQVIGLLRGDGTYLVRYPASPQIDSGRVQPAKAVADVLAASGEGGITMATSAIDAREKMYAYRKLPNYDIYVLTAIDSNAIRQAWIKTMAMHLIFGVPATLSMIAIGFVALRRTRREVHAYDQLRDEVARRETTELALRQAQKMEAVGRLTGGVAHDFNNLLTAILGNIDLATRRLKTDDERIPRSLEAVRQAAQRAATLVQRLLTFSRQHLQEVKAVDINRLVQGMSDLLHRTIGENIMIETVLGGGLWRTAIDPNQLENAILNLAVNARDAMPNGGQLTIETANIFIDEAYAARSGGEISAGQHVLLAVSDTGTGMPPEIRDKVFEPFFTTKRAGLGSGLGLSMVYGFVKQSSGHIQIYSEIGQGTSIKLYFPRLAQDSELSEWPAQEAETPDQSHLASHAESILLVEDDESVASYVREALIELGYRVESASNAQTALAILRSDIPITLLFTDVVLPGGLNGRELAIEALKIRPKLRVLYATGYTRNAIIHHGRLDADVDLLSKPFTTDALARKVREVLERPAS